MDDVAYNQRQEQFLILITQKSQWQQYEFVRQRRQSEISENDIRRPSFISCQDLREISSDVRMLIIHVASTEPADKIRQAVRQGGTENEPADH